MLNIERIEQFSEFQTSPCIFKKGIEHWPSLKKWSPQFFKKEFGNLDVILNYNLPDKECPYLHQAEQYIKSMPLKNFIDYMAKNDRCYISQQEIRTFHGLESDFNFFDIIPKSEHDKKVYTNIWIGKNTRSGLHYDYSDNFLVQIYGIKEVFLAAPEEIKYLYPLPENFTKTQVNPLDLDFKKFPQLKKATFFKGKINPGEVLFIPKGWFHYLYAPNESISLNCWYGDDITTKTFLLSFYRSGWRVWMQFVRDFTWHGILRKPVKDRLFCSPPLGKLAYDSLTKTILA